ncbi:MAG TPA: zf-HC2 domain-containing protein [Patescibacteria group bacterium]|nr:zf-HC2 domain-containing protein [Patescibacteria group bacterium]
MNHPKPEEWVPYVYGETAGAVRRQLSEHLRECAHCRQEIESWQRSLKGLDAWKLPRAGQPQMAIALPFLKWAVTAMVVLFAGVLIGRATAPKVDAEKLRATIVPQIQQQLSSQLAELAHQEVARAAGLSRTYTDQVAQQLYVAIKKDVDTLALNTDAGLRDTARQLVQLADFKEPEPLNTQTP